MIPNFALMQWEGAAVEFQSPEIKSIVFPPYDKTSKSDSKTEDVRVIKSNGEANRYRIVRTLLSCAKLCKAS